MNIVIYGTPTCHYCDMSKGFLDSLGVQYTYKDASDDSVLKELTTLIGGEVRSVPQIFDGIEHIGGYNEMRAYVYNNR